MAVNPANAGQRPLIGVFDSGVGGLTVLHELLQQVPFADYLYFGDTARLPYGSKSVETVARYAISAARFLESHGAGHIVIACNTASALALEQIVHSVQAPVLGVIEPGASAAAARSRSRKVVVIATEGTVGSQAYRQALAKHSVVAYEKACPLFVPLVEEGWNEHPVTEQVARIYLDEVFSGPAAEADALVLGCTHYPLLKPLLRRMVPERVAIVDSAESTAALMRQQVDGGAPAPPRQPQVRFFATDSVEKFRRAGEKFLQRPIGQVEHVDLET